MIWDELMTRDPVVAPMDSLDDWWTRHQAVAERIEASVDVALAAGFDADRVGYAFGSGYCAAGHALFSGTAGRRIALCATEEGGVQPGAIQTRLSEGRLNGQKRFVTFGSHAEVLLVVCSVGERDGRNLLAVVAIEPRPGVVIEPLPATPFVPEIPHAAVRFENVAVTPEEVLPGDGYSAYLKPFRTVEDAHVFAALLGMLIRIGRGSWTTGTVERLLACAAAVRELALADSSSRAVHAALGGTLKQCVEVIDALDFEAVDAATRSRWERDRRLLKVASSARTARLAAAWERLG
jgi:acyl-CoA dehydrogenase